MSKRSRAMRRAGIVSEKGAKAFWSVVRKEYSDVSNPLMDSTKLQDFKNWCYAATCHWVEANISDESTNEDRAERARSALDHYQRVKGEVVEFTEDEVTGLITDLLHCAHSQLGVSADVLLDRSKGHFEVEIQEEK